MKVRSHWIRHNGFPLFLLVFAAISPSAAQSHTADTFLNLVQAKTANRGSCKESAGCTCSIADEAIALRLLSEYGSVFAAKGVKTPNRCIFENEAKVAEFQRAAGLTSEIINGVQIELQQEAMTSLSAAQSDAEKIGLRITPLDGSIAGKRTYTDTVRIWNSRYLRALSYWVTRGKISSDEAEAARTDNVITQIRKVMDWEKDGLNFGTNIRGSIFSSTAPPGTSQHLSMLAFDLVQYSNGNLRAIMNKHGWFQTVVNDPPHFTFLGLRENELRSRGLKSVKKGGYQFWVPDL